MMKAVILLLCACSFAHADFLASQAGKNLRQFDHRGYCTSMGKAYNGYGWSAGSGKATIKVYCNGKKETVVCTYGGGLTIKSCSGPEGGAKHPVPPAEEKAPAKPPPAASAQAPGDYKNTAVQDASCGGLTDKEAQEMLDLHNKMRCAVGAPPIRWNKALACQAQKTQNKIGAFTHSKSYDLPISSGENLATGKSMATAAWMWFTEYTQDDCTKGFSMKCGHFTAMTWAATTEVGCGIGRNDPAFGSTGVIRCQYANSVPNFGNGFKANVALFKGPKAAYDKCGLSFADAKRNAQQFRSWGILKPKSEFGASLGLYNAEVPAVGLAQGSTILGAAAILGGAIVMFAIGASIRRWRAPAPEGFEGLDLEPLESGEVDCPE